MVEVRGRECRLGWLYESTHGGQVDQEWRLGSLSSDDDGVHTVFHHGLDYPIADPTTACHA
jgi:hypothetical protein